MAEEIKEELHEEEKLDVEKDVLEEVPSEEKAPAIEVEGVDVWTPRTSLGKAVKEKKITDIREILRSGKKIMEAPMVDMLIPDLETDLLLIGQSRGKFGGGQ